MYKDCGWSGGKAGDKQKGNNEQWLCNVVIFLMVTSWFLCSCWLFNSMFSFKVFSDSTWDMLRLKTGNFWRYTFVLSYVWFCFKISMIQITCSFFLATFLNFQISFKNTNGLMQVTFNWLNFFCISSIAFFKSSLSFWYIDWTFLTSFTWTKRWKSPSWRSSTWTSPAPPRWSPSSATTSCSLFGEPAPCLCSQLAGCCSTRWCLV